MKYVLTTTEPPDVDITHINQPDVYKSLVAFDGLLGEFLGILSLEIPCPQVIAREMVIYKVYNPIWWLCVVFCRDICMLYAVTRYWYTTPTVPFWLLRIPDIIQNIIHVADKLYRIALWQYLYSVYLIDHFQSCDHPYKYIKSVEVSILAWQVPQLPFA